MLLADPVVAMSFTDVLRDLGYIGLVLLLLAETIFPPIPSEVVLPLAGYLVETGEFSFVPALVVSTAGSLIGAIIRDGRAIFPRGDDNLLPGDRAIIFVESSRVGRVEQVL